MLRQSRRWLLLGLFFLLTLQGSPAQKIAEVKVDGSLLNTQNKPDISGNISTVSIVDDLLLAADEGGDILVFNKESVTSYREAEHVCITPDEAECGLARQSFELDIEASAMGRRHLYIAGSHSLARQRANDPTDLLVDLKRVKSEPSRFHLYRIRLSKKGKIKKDTRPRNISLQSVLVSHPILAPFTRIPSKENGVDIEALAVIGREDGEALMVGFRGPVLRGNLAVVMEVEFDEGKFRQDRIRQDDQYPRLHVINLNGRGIRSMASLQDGGFVLLGGPVGDNTAVDASPPYQVYYWDGKTSDPSLVPRSPICSINVDPGHKAEGLEVLNPSWRPGETLELMVVFDGAERGGAGIYHCDP